MQQMVAVLVLSFDGNSDMWDPFFRLFFRYWPDCQYKVYLTVNEKNFVHERVEVISTGRPVSWSDELLTAIDKVQEDYVLVFLEDYFLYQKVNSSEIEHLLNVMMEKDADFFRLGTFPARYRELWPASPLKGSPGLNKVDPTARYLVNLQCGIWKKEVLKKLLVSGESPWQFEINGSKRFAAAGYVAIGLDAKKGVNVVHGPFMYLCGALTRGVLMRSAIRLTKREGIILETGNRKVETPVEEFDRNIYIALPLPMRRVYLGIKRRIQRILGISRPE